MLTRSGGQPADKLHSRQFPEFSSAMNVDNAPKIYHISKRNKLVACLRKTCTGENLFFPFFPPLFNETMAYSQRQVSFNALVKCCNDAGTYEINEQNTCTVVMVERCKQIFEVTWCEMTLCEISEHGENRKIWLDDNFAVAAKPLVILSSNEKMFDRMSEHRTVKCLDESKLQGRFIT